ncbi:hypothetical protein X975_12685, partial [Stegodyphus mimosarum]
MDSYRSVTSNHVYSHITIFYSLRKTFHPKVLAVSCTYLYAIHILYRKCNKCFNFVFLLFNGYV